MFGSQEKVKRRGNWMQWTLPTVLFAIAICIILTSYNSSIHAAVSAEEESKLVDLVYSYARGFENRVDFYEKVIAYTADSCATAENPMEEENVRMISKLGETYHFVNVFILTGETEGVDRYGVDCPDVARRYYNRLPVAGAALSGFFKTPDGKYVSLLSAPIRDEEQVLGFVVAEYQPDEMKEIVNTPNYISANVYAYVSDTGQIMDQAGLESRFMAKGTNLFEDSESYVFTEGSVKEMKENLKAGKAGVMRARINAKNERLFIYQPAGDNGDFVIESANQQMLARKIQDSCRPTTIMVNVVYLILAVFAVVLVAINIFNATTHARTKKELQDKAESDLLTGLLNKIATEDKIKGYLQGEGQDRTSMMFVLDIDNFKNINDTMGHAFGDEVIAELGRQLSAEFRATDIVGRTGGDEFTIFLKDMKDDKILHAEAERVLNIFKNFKVGEYTKYFATASIGVAVYPQDANSFETLYKAADQALYKAKNRGKNQMAFYRD